MLFKPAFVKITSDPEEPKAGQKAILTCESGSSNPTSRIVWRYKNKPLRGVDTAVKSGEYGGNITTNMLEIEIKPEDHGAIIICEAINDGLQESVLNAKTLSVKCESSKLLFRFEQHKKRKSSGLQKLRKKSWFTLFRVFAYSERMIYNVLLNVNNVKSYVLLSLFWSNTSLHFDPVIQVFINFCFV